MAVQKDRDLLQFLSKVPLFASIPEARLAEIGEECEEVFFPKGETVFLEGDPGDSMYLIKSGAVGVYGAGRGGESFVASLHRGDFFGEMALLTGKPRTATIRVLLDAQLFRLTKAGFDDLLKRSPGVALYLSRLYAHRFAETNELVLDEPRPTFYSMIATHQGLGKGRFLYSLAYHLATEAGKRVLVVDLQEGLFKERGGYGLEEAACPNSDLLEVFPARFKGVMEKAWYCHERGFDVFVLPALKEAEYWEALENNLAFIMDLLREKSDYVFFNIPVSFRPVGERVVRLCDRALVLLNNQEGALPEVRECVLKTVGLMRGRRDHVRAGVSHLVGDRGIPRRDLAEALGLPETPMVWVGRESGPESGLIETDKSFPVRGARALARELGGVRVGLVLGAGGARGWAHLGVIKVLEEEGIPIDMIVGSSVGSMVGCLYAYSASIEETIGLVMERLPGRFRARRRLFDYTIPLHGIIRGAKIRRMTREAVRGADFLDLKIPVYVVAVDFHTGGEVVLERGDVTEAVRASISLPGIMDPVFHEGRWLLDGGLISPVPVDVAVQKGADTIIAVCVERGKSGLGKRSHKAPGIMSVMSRTMNIIHAHATRDFAQKADIVLYPDVEQFHWDDFHKVSRLIKAGEEACRAKLDEIRAAVSC